MKAGSLPWAQIREPVPGRCRERTRWRGDDLGLVRRHFGERKDIRLNHAETRLRSQLAAQEPHRFEIRIDIVGAAADEPCDEHTAKCRDVHLGREGRLDRHLEEIGARARKCEQDETSDRCDASRGH